MRLTLLFLLIFLPQCLGLKALIYNIGIGKSHFMFTGAMVDSLVDRGHEAELLLAIWNPVAANNGTDKAGRVFRVEVEDPPLVHAGYLRPFDPPNNNFYELFDQSRLLFCERILSNSKLMADLRSAKYDIGLSPPYDSCGMSLFHMLGIQATAIFTATPPTFFVMESLGIPAPPSFVTADPRLKVFITHAGMNSFVEFTRHGVPALTVPLSVDQHVNAASAVGLGIALHLKKEEISAKKIKEKLEILLSDNRYRQRAIKLSQALKASPNRPQQTFVESVEFAAAFPDTSEYLQLPSVYLNPFVVHSFDVFAVIFGVIFTFLLFFVPIVVRAVMYSCNLPPSHLKYKHE
uniref:glucuronosyltransferase n=1 Tax=Bursaphelenchus xylophilus TaxID=6326 RepID=A0A1I7SDH8_BURXY